MWKRRTGKRQDEEKSRAKERIFSFRNASQAWDPKNQRLEMWKLYNTEINKGESIRVFPISNWTETDIWQYIKRENIPIVPLYFAAERPVVERDGNLIMVDDERMRLNPGEKPQMKMVRFRTLGCYPLSGGVESTATTIDEVIAETLASAESERTSRVIIDGGKFKWNNGKFDVLGDSPKFGKGAFTARLRNSIWRDIGACCAPMNAYLNIAGLETLGLRMQRICSNAQLLAEHFKTLRYVKEVNYPGLKDNPYYSLIQQQFRNGYAGGILTIRVESKEKAFQIINNLKYVLNISNIGDTKTLVVHPASTIFAHSSPEQKEAAGVYDDLIRISVGLEDIEDLIADFDNAFHNADMMELIYAGSYI